METTIEKTTQTLNEEIATKSKTIQTKQLQKYVWGLVGIWFIFLITFIMAYLEVCQSKKYTISPLALPSWEEKQR